MSNTLTFSLRLGSNIEWKSLDNSYLNEASSLDQIKMTENWLEFDLKKIDNDEPKLHNNEHKWVNMTKTYQLVKTRLFKFGKNKRPLPLWKRRVDSIKYYSLFNVTIYSLFSNSVQLLNKSTYLSNHSNYGLIQILTAFLLRK